MWGSLEIWEDLLRYGEMCVHKGRYVEIWGDGERDIGKDGGMYIWID